MGAGFAAAGKGREGKVKNRKWMVDDVEPPDGGV
jgi:hypothetical protein